MDSRTPAGQPIIAFYQQVKEGDILKFYNESNITKSGGGARDLRVSPYTKFWDSFKRFFPIEINTRERKGNIYSIESNETTVANISLMGPTNARPNECRICVINKINGWKISKDEYDKKKDEGFEWFFLLILDANDNVWASKFCTDVIDQMNDKIKTAIKNELIKNKKNSIRGVCIF